MTSAHPAAPHARWRFLLAIAIILGAAAAPLPAEDTPTGEEILRLVRMSQALQDLQRLTGRLRNDDDRGSTHPLELTMTDGMIRFFLRSPNEVISLQLDNSGSRLKRVTAAGSVEVPVTLYSQRVRDTAINYEDLSMRFLYWPNAQVTGTGTVSFMKCWIVRVTNPDGRGPYGTVDVWVHQGSGAIAQMFAYDPKGRKAKTYTVKKGQKYRGAWILKQMRVESYDPGSGRVNGRTYLEIDDPR